MAETLNPVRRLFEGAPPGAASNQLPDRMISADSHITEPPHIYAKCDNAARLYGIDVAALPSRLAA
jgi:hypothetical protein